MKKIIILAIVSLMLTLTGCGSPSPAGSSGTGGGSTTGTGTISGIVYGLSDSRIPVLSTLLASATVVADTRSDTSAASGSYTITGLGGTTTLSAAATGYVAQTVAGVPTTAGQNIHLNPVAWSGTTITQPIRTASVAGWLTMASGGVQVAAANTWVYATDPQGNYAGAAMTNAFGYYTIPVSWYGGLSTNTMTVYAYIYTTTSIAQIGYTSVNVTANTIVGAPTVVMNPTTVGTMSVTISNMPAASSTGVALYAKLPGAGGAIFYLNGSSSVGNMTTFNASFSVIPNATYIVRGDCNGNSWSSTVQKTNLPLAPITISFMDPPIITSPVSVPAASATNFVWNNAAGAQQYLISVSGIGYGWQGYTNAPSLIKPLFIPSNGGNFTPGSTYFITIAAYDVAQMGTTTSSVLNPMMQAVPTMTGQPLSSNLNTSPGGLNPYVQISYPNTTFWLRDDFRSSFYFTNITTY